MQIDPEREKRIIQDQPPFFRSWSGVYSFVLGVLAALVLLFHLFTQHYK